MMKHREARDGPPIDITKSRYDLSTYYGRIRHFQSVTSPLTLFYSSKSLEDAQQLIKDYQEGNERGRKLWGREEEMGVWKAKQLVDSSIHPDTGKPVPLPFRMSAFVPTNMIICLGMLMPNATLRSTIFWQWANQSLNVAVNSANANKSTPLSTQEMLTSYACATAASVGIAMGLTRVVPLQMTILRRLVPFASVATAGIVNIGVMRSKEMTEGVTVYEPGTSEQVGTSRIAGCYAVGQTAASRIMVNVPTLIFPPLVMTWLERRGTFRGPHAAKIHTLANLGLITSSLFFFLPPAIAFFPQRGSVKVKNLEEHFHDLTNKDGEKIEKVEYNKGL
ncbi:tricarboxylate carrier [Atractiella rhizophila]|nr:tricarboxylate carrier [Atractiella rhizophila]